MNDEMTDEQTPFTALIAVSMGVLALALVTASLYVTIEIVRLY